MKDNKKDFPVKSVNDLKLKSEDLESIKAESLKPECMDNLVEIDSDEGSVLRDYHLNYTCRKVDSEVLQERYVFSGYIIDPNRFRLRKDVNVWLWSCSLLGNSSKG